MSIYRGRNKHDIYLASLLYDAIEDRDIRSVKLLLIEKGADPNLILPRKQISPFHLIIGNDSDQFTYDVVLLLLKYGGNPNVQSDDGLTPVHIAAAWGRVEILKLLLDCGGDPENRDCDSKTPLDYAIEEKFPECSNLLKDYMPKKCFKPKSDCNHFNLTLDKILVNNGTTLGEYEIVNEYKTDTSTLKKDLEKLQNLPESKTNDIIMDWFNSRNDNVEMAPKIGNNSAHSDDDGSELKESDREITKYQNVHNISFRKVYRKKMSPKKNATPTIRIQQKPANDTTFNHMDYSRESGINTLNSTKIDDSAPFVKIKTETSSDYVTCNSDKNASFDLNQLSIFTNDLTNKSIKSEGISSTDLSFVSVSEIYKYEDREQGIVLYERRFLKTPISEHNESVKSFVSSNVSLPETIDYEDIDTEGIRNELTQFGYNPGPITVTTKRIYLKKLKQLRKLPVLLVSPSKTKVFSGELEKTLKHADWIKTVVGYRSLDEAVSKQFSAPDPSMKWREGVIKSSFTYLLLDPRFTVNLPGRAENLKPLETWKVFLSSIFYVGKGKRSRPYSHLYEAVNLWNGGARSSESAKLQRILDIWTDNCGVVCLHLFQNTIPVEAYTREAAIINAIKVTNLSNAKGGNFYGVAATWTTKEKEMFGVFLLYKAMMIFLNEGERQLCPNDID